MLLAAASRIIAAFSSRDATGIEALLRGRFYRDCSAGQRVRIGRAVELVGRRNIRFGTDVTLYGNTYLNAVGEHGHITIGNRTHLDRNCVLYGQGGLDIGANCAIAAGVIIYTQTNQYRLEPGKPVSEQPVSYKPVRVADHVWIGAGAILLPGVNIGAHAVIAAGAVVTRDVADGHVVGGVPAHDISAPRSIAGGC